MAKFFELLTALVKDALDSHISKVQVDQISADLVSIKVFFGIPDVRVGATQDEIDTLGGRVKAETAAIDQFDSSLNQPPPPEV